jgi:hypothetical protein
MIDKDLEKLADRIMDVIVPERNIRRALDALDMARSVLEEELLECYEEVMQDVDCECCGKPINETSEPPADDHKVVQ